MGRVHRSSAARYCCPSAVVTGRYWLAFDCLPSSKGRQGSENPGRLERMATYVRWSDLGAARPDLVEAGLGLLYQFGVGLAFLSTVRADGGPRLHPICPIVVDGALVAHIMPSPKHDDLRRVRGTRSGQHASCLAATTFSHGWPGACGGCARVNGWCRRRERWSWM